MIFLWSWHNTDHIGKHGVSREEAAFVVLHPRPGFPKRIEAGKRLVRGQTRAGRYLQVIYILPEPDRIDITLLEPSDVLALHAGDEVIYVLHARELTEKEKRSLRR